MFECLLEEKSPTKGQVLGVSLSNTTDGAFEPDTRELSVREKYVGPWFRKERVGEALER